MGRPGGFFVWKAGDLRRQAPRTFFPSERYQSLAYDKAAWGTVVHNSSAGSTLSEERRMPSVDEMAAKLSVGKPLGSVEIQKLLDVDEGGSDEAESDDETG